LQDGNLARVAPRPRARRPARLRHGLVRIKPAFALETPEFDTLRRMLRDHSGIWLADGKLSFLQVRLAARMEARGISAPREYVHFLKYDGQGGEELQALLDAVTVNETWFFREFGPVETWREAVLPGLLQRGRRVRLWSAGCSTGEEAYTLAMALHAVLPAPALAACEILATDISQRARCPGQYDPTAAPHRVGVARALLSRRSAASPGARRAARRGASLVRFGRANPPTALPGRVGQPDFIPCRNVILSTAPAAGRAGQPVRRFAARRLSGARRQRAWRTLPPCSCRAASACCSTGAHRSGAMPDRVSPVCCDKLRAMFIIKLFGQVHFALDHELCASRLRR
jgi:chemotaxis protein methyltransferase CheR